MSGIVCHAAAIDELDAATLGRLLRLRSEVFVVEQGCAYQDLDGLDLAKDTLHLWAADGERVLGYLRLLSEPDGAARIGRVCVARPARGQGLAAGLLRRGIERSGEASVVLNAQQRLAGWYQRFGFRPDGPVFTEDGIEHLPMRRAPATGEAAR